MHSLQDFGEAALQSIWVCKHSIFSTSGSIGGLSCIVFRAKVYCTVLWQLLGLRSTYGRGSSLQPPGGLTNVVCWWSELGCRLAGLVVDDTLVLYCPGSIFGVTTFFLFYEIIFLISFKNELILSHFLSIQPDFSAESHMLKGYIWSWLHYFWVKS